MEASITKGTQVKSQAGSRWDPLIPRGIPGAICGIVAGSHHSHLGLKINPTWDPA